MDRLAAIETFDRVVDAGSFAGAAKRLRIEQPTVSKTVAQFEGAARSPSPAPVDACQEFYKRAKRAIEEADAAELAARGAAATLSGRLRISATVSFARPHVMPRLPIFRAQHASLDVEVILDDRDIDLIEAGIDVGLRLGQLSDSALFARR